MRAQFISPDDPQWQRHLDANWHDFYHLPEYVKLCAYHEGGIPMAFLAHYRGASFLAPLIIRPLPESLNASPDWCDCVSPYGYSTPLVAPTQEQLPAFIEAFLGLAKERNMVAAFFRLHPFSELNKGDLCADSGSWCTMDQTIYLDLSLTEDEFWKQVRRNHKQNYQRLVQDGFDVSVDDWGRLGEFASLYRATMQRVGAVTCLYSEQYFTDLKTILGPAMHLCCVRSRTGSMVAGGASSSRWEGWCIITCRRRRRSICASGPNKLIIPFMRAWAQERYEPGVASGRWSRRRVRFVVPLQGGIFRYSGGFLLLPPDRGSIQV
jgi:hypothetical protein